MNPLFSIVIVNYNHGKFLEQAILSVINQSCDDYELILIDGGSNDNSLEIIKKYSNSFSYWISEPDEGQSDAFNKGFSQAKGEFYFWINADDILLPNSLMKAKDKIQSNKNNLWFVANIIFFNEEGKILKCARGPKWRNFLYDKVPINVYGPTSIFHKSIFWAAGGFDKNLKFAMDTDLWMRFKSMGVRFHRINEYFWGFRVHKDSKTSNQFFKVKTRPQMMEEFEIIKKNRVKYNRLGFYIDKAYKLCSGLYFFSFLDTVKFKDKNIFKLNL